MNGNGEQKRRLCFTLNLMLFSYNKIVFSCSRQR